MTTTHRIPWTIDYAYTEVVSDTPLTEEEMANVMFEAVSMEDQYRVTWGLPKVGEEPVAPPPSQRQEPPPQQQPQRAQAYTPNPQQAQPSSGTGNYGNGDGPRGGGGTNTFVDHTQSWVCKQCNGPAEQSNRVVNTKFGQKYPVNCLSCKNEKGYAFTTAWADA